MLLMLSIAAKAQENEGLKLISRAYKDSIKLRWAPTSHVDWMLGNEYGYVVERIAIYQDGKLIDNPEKEMLTHRKPAPLESWKEPAESNDYAAIAAQAIYGDDFQVSEQKSGMARVISKTKEQQQRYSFTLYASDMSVQVSKLAGLYYKDTTIRNDARYLYRVYLDAPDSMEVDTGVAYTGYHRRKPLPQPLDMEADFQGRKVSISWNYNLMKNTYTAYWVERAGENMNFSRITENPYVLTYKSDEPPERIVKADSVPRTGKTYYYRVKGINAFGETGPPSDTVSGQGYELLKAFPKVGDVKVLGDKAVLNWSFPQKLEDKLEGFRIENAGDDQGPYHAVTDTLLKPDARDYLAQPEKTTSYYRIVAVAGEKEERHSYPAMVKLIDSIPPSAPGKPGGLIDTTGIVRLKWESNTEEDLLGYRVYRSNFKNREYVQVTSDVAQTSDFTDTVAVNTLTSQVYYKITAIDQHYNESDFSKVARLRRPDLIPPVTPVFSAAEARESGNFLKWHPSGSDDVEKHLLYRRTPGTKWKLLAISKGADTTNSHVDSTLKPGKIAEYTLIAVDSSNLESDPAQPVRLRRLISKVPRAVSDISYNKDKEDLVLHLQWNYPLERVSRYQVYRAVNEGTMQLHKSVPAEQLQFSDSRVQIGNTYKYRIRAVFENNTKSKYSQIVQINF